MEGLTKRESSTVIRDEPVEAALRGACGGLGTSLSSEPGLETLPLQAPLFLHRYTGFVFETTG